MNTTTETTTTKGQKGFPKGPLTEEQKKERAEAKLANEKALEPYMASAVADVARIRGTTVEVITSMMDIGQIRAQVRARAEHFKKQAEGVKTRAPKGQKWGTKLTAQFARAFGFAKAHGVSDADVMAAIKTASENPIAPVVRKPVAPAKTN